MPGLPHDGLSPMLLDPWREITRTFHIKDHTPTRISRQHISREQHQLAVGINNVPRLGNHPYTITIPIERKPDFRVARFKGVDQVSQVVGYRRVRMMIWKSAIDFAKQLGDLTPKLAVQRRRKSSGHPVTTEIGRAHV